MTRGGSWGDLTLGPSRTGAGSQRQPLANRHAARPAAPRPVGEGAGGEVRPPQPPLSIEIGKTA